MMNSSPMQFGLRPMLAHLALVVIVCGMLSCGGGGVAPGVGGQGTGSSGEQSGAVTGLGSVIVEGTRYDEGAATSRVVEFDPANPAPADLTTAKVGMITQLSFDDAQVIKTLRIMPTVIGTIERRTADALVVAGQIIKLQSTGALPVVFDGLADFAELAVTDRIEVHAHLDASGQLLATRISRLDALSAVQTRITGLIVAIENSGQRLRIGELAVDLSTATRVLPLASAFAVGQRVVVWSDSGPVAGRLSARTIASDSAIDSTSQLRAGGVVRSLDRPTNRFRVGAVVVDSTGPVTYQNGGAAELADGKVVRVKGLASAGILKANEIVFLRDGADSSVQLTGVIGSLLSAASFQVRNVTVDASSAATEFRNGGASNLADGALVKVDGRIVAGTVRAERVEFIVAEDIRAQAFRGAISALDQATGKFALLGISMQLTTNAIVSSNGGNSLPRSSMANGQIATATGSYLAGLFVVSSIELRTDNSAEVVKAEGLAYLVKLSEQSLHVNGLTVHWNASTRIDGSISDLRGGTKVRVEGTVVANELVASRLTLRP